MVAYDERVQIPAGLSRLQKVRQSLLLHTRILAIGEVDEISDHLFVSHSLDLCQPRHVDVVLAAFEGALCG